MTVPSVQGGRDAVIIPFPLHKARRDLQELEDSVIKPHDGASVSATTELSERAHSVAPGEQVWEAPENVPPDRAQRRARNVTLHALASRGQSRSEIVQRLNSRDVAPEVIAEELEALEGSGLIDDEALARELVEKYAIRGGLGRRGVMEKLRARKIPDHIIENALRMVTPEDETSALRELAISKLRSVESLAPNVARRRLGAFLLRKGYSPGEVYPLVSDLIR